MNRLALLALVLVTACGSKPAPPRAAPVVRTAENAQLGLTELLRELEADVLENYLQLGLGNMEAYADIISQRDPVTLVGIGPSDVTANNSRDCLHTSSSAPTSATEACDYARDRLPFRRRPLCLPDSPVDAACQGIYSKRLNLHVSRDHEVAWVFDELSYRLPHNRRQAAIPLRFSAVFVRDVERWVMVQEHISYPLPDRLTVALAEDDQLSAPDDLATGQHSSDVFVALARAYLAPSEADRARLNQDRQALLALSPSQRDEQDPRTSGFSDDRIVVFPDPRGEYHGIETLSARSLIDRFGPKTTLQFRSPRIFLSSSEQVAWMAANLELQITAPAASGAAQKRSIGLRLTAVFERDEPGEWHLMQAHMSVPIRKQQLETQMFGRGLAEDDVLTEPAGTLMQQ